MVTVSEEFAIDQFAGYLMVYPSTVFVYVFHPAVGSGVVFVLPFAFVATFVLVVVFVFAVVPIGPHSERQVQEPDPPIVLVPQMGW